MDTTRDVPAPTADRPTPPTADRPTPPVAAASTAETTEPVTGPASEVVPPSEPEHRGRRLLLASRPLLFAAAVAVIVLGVHALAISASVNPWSGRTEYGLHTTAMIVAAVAGVCVWLSRRRGRTWDADLVPALFGGLAALTMLIVLNGTPFEANGVRDDQSFRATMVTQFAQSWGLPDYTYRDLPAYYAPGYFWVLGRIAALADIAPWHMLKYGAIAVAFANPILTYLFWRRVVPLRVAMLISAVPLIVPELYEPYNWVVEVIFIAWCLEAVLGLRREGVKPRSPVVDGLIGSLLFVCYYYYFFGLVLLLPLYALVGWRLRTLDPRQLRRGCLVLAIAAVGSAFYWAPLGWNFLTAPDFRSLNNRWITNNSGDLALPMLQPTVVGALCLLGLCYLVLTARRPLSRAMLAMLGAFYAWHAFGYVAAALDNPLMSFRMRSLVPITLLAGAALAFGRIARFVAGQLPNLPESMARRVDPANLLRLAAVGGVLLALFAGDGFVTTVVGDSRIKLAHDETLPDGTLPGFHSKTAKARTPSTDRLRAPIEAGFTADRQPVVLSDRTDLFVYYPYYGFVQWNANYSHPTAQYHRRLDFLREAAKAPSAQAFADRMADNPYDKIDVIVLRQEKQQLVYTTADDNFPFGSVNRKIYLPVELISSAHFRITKVDDYLVAVLIG